MPTIRRNASSCGTHDLPSAPGAGRRLPIGAEVTANGVHFRVWAPHHQEVEVVIEGRAGQELAAEGNGYHSALVAGAQAGTLYRYRLDGVPETCPDPASRFQPQGPRGPSAVVDPGRFSWTDAEWRGVPREGQVLYEMHLGTFTPQGTWEAAARELPELARLGVTVIELMPVAEFAGAHGWGYDGVSLFAPYHVYGAPDDMRRFVDRAHAVGLGVILDVVYNHLGPEGNCLPHFDEHYFTDRYATDWGAAINFDGAHSVAVREFFVSNAAYWIGEFHLDGLRLDATQNIYDSSDEHVLVEITRAVRRAAPGRQTFVVAENEPQDRRLVLEPEQGGFGLDALWNDDFHHSAMVALTGRREAYYSDHLGRPQEFVSAAKWGTLYQGQFYTWQSQRRGTPCLDLRRTAFVNYLQNHDQVANSARGLRVHALTSPGRFRAMTAVLLLGPGTPLLFQGQEFAASAPFLYFSDQPSALAGAIRSGRAEFLRQFPGIAEEEMTRRLDDPVDRATFERCRLDLREREQHAPAYEMHGDLLRLRREDATIRSGRVDGAVLGPEAFVLRFFGEDGDDRLLLVNLGADLHLAPAPEPLLAPPLARRWGICWSSEDPRYGGCGTAPIGNPEDWRLAGHAAVLLRPVPAERSAPSSTGPSGR